MKALDIGQAHIIGVSMGGRIAMALALQHSEMVKDLILVSTFARQVMNPGQKGFTGMINRIPKYVAGMSEYPQPEYAFMRQLVASRSYDCIGLLGEIRVPALVLHGRDDTLVPLALAEELHAGIAGSKMTTFAGGHVFIITMPEQFCKAVAGFLAAAK